MCLDDIPHMTGIDLAVVTLVQAPTLAHYILYSNNSACFQRCCASILSTPMPPMSSSAACPCGAAAPHTCPRTAGPRPSHPRAPPAQTTLRRTARLAPRNPATSVPRPRWPMRAAVDKSTALASGGANGVRERGVQGGAPPYRQSKSRRQPATAARMRSTSSAGSGSRLGYLRAARAVLPSDLPSRAGRALACAHCVRAAVSGAVCRRVLQRRAARQLVRRCRGAHEYIKET
jgi:hypothetical protein